jgi:tRNA pseudouridine(55) synthase
MQLDLSIRDQIIPIWKPVGISTHTISKGVSRLMDVPVAHTGTLDPMADGVIVLLSGDIRYSKIEFAGWKKEYEFEMLFGVSTDTFDPMGLVTATDLSFDLNEDALRKALDSFQPSYIQTYPPFSAKKVNGKPMHYYAQRDELSRITAPTIEAHIYELDILGIRKLRLGDFISLIVPKISQVEGFFRQETILNGWDTFSKAIDTNVEVPLIKLCALVSRGVYVRALTVDVAASLGTCALTYSITRTKNGKYGKAECFDLPKF